MLLALLASALAVSAPPATMGLAPFYTKHVDAGGIPVVSSAKVPDEALFKARDIVDGLLVKRPDLRATLVRNGARVGIMAVDETTTDLPEQSDWKKPAKDDPRLSKCDVRDYDTTIGLMSDRDYWAMRARGMGGLYTTGAEENLMAVPGTRYYGETILLHEFAHNILNAIEDTDPALYGRIQAAYTNAKDRGLWRGAYMALNIHEYWAEGSQFWFNSNKRYWTDDVSVVSDRDLKKHDPQLYKVLSEVYGPHRIKADPFYNHEGRMLSAKADLVNDCFS